MVIYEKAGGEIMEKYFDVGVKLAKLYAGDRHKDLAACAETFDSLLEKAEALAATNPSLSTTWTKKTARAAADCLSDHVDALPREQGALVEKIFVVLVTVDDGEVEAGDDDNVEQKCGYYERWIRAMLANYRPVADVIGACGLMRETFPDALFPIELLAHFELSLGCCAGDEVGGSNVASSVDLEKLEDLRSALRRVDPKSPLVSAIEAVDAFATRNFLSARDGLKAASDAARLRNKASTALNIPVVVFLARAYFALHDHRAVEACVKEIQDFTKARAKGTTATDVANAFVSGERVDRALGLLSARAKVEGGSSEEDMEEAISALERLVSRDDDDANADPLGAFIGFSSSSSLSVAKIEQIIETAKSRGFQSASLLTLEAVLMAKKGETEAALSQFARAVEANPDHGQLRFWLGKTLWDKTVGGIPGPTIGEEERGKHREDLDVCFSELLLAAKLDRFYAPTFLFLGHFYSRVSEEPAKALKCYQRAFDLDDSIGDAGSRCVDLLTSQNRAEEALALLVGVTRSAPPSRGTKWAWLRLSVRHLDVGDYEAAVTALQDLLKADARDWTVWECLGEAYSSRGSHTAALKAFERAVELNPRDAAFSRFQTARIKQVTCAFLEASSDYAVLLDEQPDFIPALVGMGETLIQLAREALDRFFNRKAVDLVERAVQTLTQAATLRPDLVCVWKLLGDACTIVREAPDHHCVGVKVPAKLAHDPDAAERKLRIR